MTDEEIAHALDRLQSALDRIAEAKDVTDKEIREQIRGSDLYSPMIKRVMERFWRRCDELDADGEEPRQ